MSKNGKALLNRRQIVQMILLTVGAVGLYAAAQTLPQSLAPERPADVLAQLRGGVMPPDFCAVSEGGFTEVRGDRSPIRFALEPTGPVQPGETTQLVLSMTFPDGRPIRAEAIRPTHGELVHLLAISPTLAHYAHLHPRMDPDSGQWTVDFTPEEPGRYRFFVEWMADRTGRMVQSGADLPVGGSAEWDYFAPDRSAVEKGPWRFTFTADEALIAGRPSVVRLRMAALDGRVVPLEPVMEAYAHVVAFDRSREGFAHFHPLEEGLDWQPDPREPEMTFVFFTPRAGPYILWAQVKIDGQEIFVPFQVEVGVRRRG